MSIPHPRICILLAQAEKPTLVRTVTRKGHYTRYFYIVINVDVPSVLHVFIRHDTLSFWTSPFFCTVFVSKILHIRVDVQPNVIKNKKSSSAKKSFSVWRGWASQPRGNFCLDPHLPWQGLFNQSRMLAAGIARDVSCAQRKFSACWVFLNHCSKDF